jgi:hypothetical protein
MRAGTGERVLVAILPSKSRPILSREIEKTARLQRPLHNEVFSFVAFVHSKCLTAYHHKVGKTVDARLVSASPFSCTTQVRVKETPLASGPK